MEVINPTLHHLSLHGRCKRRGGGGGGEKKSVKGKREGSAAIRAVVYVFAYQFPN